MITQTKLHHLDLKIQICSLVVEVTAAELSSVTAKVSPWVMDGWCHSQTIELGRGEAEETGSGRLVEDTSRGLSDRCFYTELYRLEKLSSLEL